MDESKQRAYYRVDGEARRSTLAAQLLIAGHAVDVVLADVSFGGAGIIIPDALGIALAVGQVVQLRFVSPALSEPLDTIADTRTRSPSEGGIQYGLQLRDPVGLQRRLPPRIAGAFNRRRCFRVTPGSDEPIEATVQRQGAPPFRLPVVCVSATGLALLATTKDEQLLLTGDRITVTFALPGEGLLCEVIANVRYTSTQPRGAVRVGVELDVKATPGFTRIESAINRYVMRQQRRMLGTSG